jgi:hypothetical protein
VDDLITYLIAVAGIAGALLGGGDRPGDPQGADRRADPGELEWLALWARLL